MNDEEQRAVLLIGETAGDALRLARTLADEVQHLRRRIEQLERNQSDDPSGE